ncbi:MAG: RsmE family RNA methyltransferase [Bacteroidota bacterium]
MEYFYVQPSEVHGSTLRLQGDEAKHLARVLRKKAGERIRVTDGEGMMYEAVIRTISTNGVECQIQEVKERVNEPRLEVTLAASLLKNPARTDFLVEKATELGVHTIIPLLCQRTIPKHDKHIRLERIALAAMKQCGRSILPKVFVSTSFPTLVRNSEHFDLKVIPHEKTEQSQFVGTVLQHHSKVKSVLIVVGPEGGFTEEEVELASEHRFVPISLGPRRLRSETAAISALSFIVGGW